MPESNGRHPANNGLEVGVGAAAWRLYHCREAASTNDLARDLPAWNAIRADMQTGGRGRFGRPFVSDPGGLWISAILPADGGLKKWAGFSLMVGVHLVRLLEHLRVPGARLRWPNDLMAGPRKLGGLLIEQSTRETLMIGLGLNVRNAPWRVDPSLKETSASLADVLCDPPPVQSLAVLAIDALADAHQQMENGGMAAAIADLNSRWTNPTPVEIALSHGGRAAGRFLGLDPRGHLRLVDDAGKESLIEHQSVEKFSERA